MMARKKLLAASGLMAKVLCGASGPLRLTGQFIGPPFAKALVCNDCLSPAGPTMAIFQVLRPQWLKPRFVDRALPVRSAIVLELFDRRAGQALLIRGIGRFAGGRLPTRRPCGKL
jgi:hypothetical protein